MADHDRHLGCWSCSHYRLTECELGRHREFSEDAGDKCSAFDYEPGADAEERDFE